MCRKLESNSKCQYSQNSMSVSGVASELFAIYNFENNGQPSCKHFRFIVKKGVYDVGYLANSILGALVGITGNIIYSKCFALLPKL